MTTWLEHVKQTRQKHNCSYKEALQLASKSWSGATYRSGSNKKGKGFIDVDKFNDFMMKKIVIPTAVATTIFKGVTGHGKRKGGVSAPKNPIMDGRKYKTLPVRIGGKKKRKGKGLIDDVKNIGGKVMDVVTGETVSKIRTAIDPDHPVFAGEKHAVRLSQPNMGRVYSYMGPGTQFKKRQDLGIKPLNDADAIAEKHDNAYFNMQNITDPEQLKRAEIQADKEALQAWKNSPDWSLPEVKVAYGAILAKMLAQSAGKLPYGIYVDKKSDPIGKGVRRLRRLRKGSTRLSVSSTRVGKGKHRRRRKGGMDTAGKVGLAVAGSLGAITLAKRAYAIHKMRQAIMNLGKK